MSDLRDFLKDEEIDEDQHINLEAFVLLKCVICKKDIGTISIIRIKKWIDEDIRRMTQYFSLNKIKTRCVECTPQNVTIYDMTYYKGKKEQ